MDLTISIVNWNVKEYLEKCLESLFKYSSGIELEVIVIDNASKDGSVSMVKEKFPQVTVIENNENLGYGSAHNQAIKLAKGRYIIFLNPDTEMLPDTLPKMLKFMDMHPEAGASGCLEISNKEDAMYRKLIPVTNFEYRWWAFCNGINRILPNLLMSRYCINFITKIMESRKKAYDTMEIKYYEAAFLLLRKKALDQVGGFDPKFFLAQEGVDLTMRIRELGWKIYRIPTIKIVHYGRKSSEKMSDAEFDRIEKNWQRRINSQTSVSKEIR